MVSKGLIKLIVLAVAALVAAVMTMLARHRAEQQEARGGCVACGSQALTIVGAEARCGACGYVGRADRGGALSQQEIEGIHGRAPDDHSH